VEWNGSAWYPLLSPQEARVAKKKPAARPRSAIAGAPALLERRAAAGLALRTIFLNLFRHNSTRLNSARYESGLRFTVTVCWREGEEAPCPAAVGHEDGSRAGHQADVEFSVSVTDLALLTRMRVDDAGLVTAFPTIRLGRGYGKELREVLGRHFGLVYPKVEDEPTG
jgi:hypothetical protein